MKINQNLLKHIPTTHKNWRDRDIILRNITFQIVIDFVELEDGLFGLEKSKKFNINKLDKIFSNSPKRILNRYKKKYQNIYNIYKECKKRINIPSPLEYHEEYEIESKLLVEIIKIRKHLWT